MSVYKDSDGQWRYRRTVRINGKSQRISGTPNANSRQAADRAERDHVDRLEHPEEHGPAPDQIGGTPFAAFATEWLATYPIAQNKHSTYVAREGHIRLHLIPYWGQTPLVDITPQRITKFAADLRVADSKATQTVQLIIRTLRKILGTAVEWGKLEILPRFPMIRVPKANFDWLTMEETEVVLAHATDWKERLTILFAVKTGVRAGELLALEWDDIDFLNKRVHIVRSFHRGRITSCKSGKDRWLPLTPALHKALAESRSACPLVFPDSQGAMQNVDSLRIILRRALRAAGMRRIKWHDLRHSFASQLVSLGIHLSQVQQWLGHSSIVTTMRYAHLAPNQNDALIAVLDK